MCRGSFFVAPERRSVRAVAAPHKGRPAFGSVSGKPRAYPMRHTVIFCAGALFIRSIFKASLRSMAGPDQKRALRLCFSFRAMPADPKGNRRACIPPARRMTARAQFAPAGSPPRVGGPSAAEVVAIHKAAGSRAAAARKKREKAAAAKTPAPAQKLLGKKRKTLFSGRIFHFCGKNLTLCFICLYFLKNLVHLLYLRWN